MQILGKVKSIGIRRGENKNFQEDFEIKFTHKIFNIYDTDILKL